MIVLEELLENKYLKTNSSHNKNRQANRWIRMRPKNRVGYVLSRAIMDDDASV